MDFEALQKRATQHKLPTSDNRIPINPSEEMKKEIIEHANTTRPICVARLVEFMEEFIKLKKTKGTPEEQKVYATLDVHGLVDRLLKKRPKAFLNPSDQYMLRDGQKGSGGFQFIGTKHESAPLVLADYQSYDEMQISACMGVSVPTHFINTGGRYNQGKAAPEGSFERKGVYVGLVGARFERDEQMEWQHVLVTRDQNFEAKGYGPNADTETPLGQVLALWAKFYGVGDPKHGKYYFPTFEEAETDTDDRFIKCYYGYLNKDVYIKRMRLSLEAFFLDANDRAQEAGKKAYAIVGGLGLGVWRLCEEQLELFAEAANQSLQAISVPHVSDVVYSYSKFSQVGGVKDKMTFTTESGNSIKFHFNRSDPAERLTGEDEGKLLVAMYAWDSNSYPGNEYWLGALSASGVVESE